ncbi:hypothetical protein NKG99_14315 [Mesorhizobium sp. M1409]|uniref:hypothetical protein n=1 Tax=unclassified Mesorhizobium TaxID=325217 RepID=UPI00333A6DCD
MSLRLGIEPWVTVTMVDFDPTGEGYAGQITVSWDWSTSTKRRGLYGASSTLFCTRETWPNRKARVLNDLDGFVTETVEASRARNGA